MRGWPARTKTFPTKADAEQWASEREAEMRRGTFVDASSLRATAVHDLPARDLRDVTPTKKGWEPETYRLKAMMRSPMAKLTLDRLSTPVVVEWCDGRREEVAGHGGPRERVRHAVSQILEDFSRAMATSRDRGGGRSVAGQPPARACGGGHPGRRAGALILRLHTSALWPFHMLQPRTTGLRHAA
jgi:hypothetical protein